MMNAWLMHFGALALLSCGAFAQDWKAWNQGLCMQRTNNEGTLHTLNVAASNQYLALENCEMIANNYGVAVDSILRVNPNNTFIAQFCQRKEPNPPTYYVQWICIPKKERPTTAEWRGLAVSLCEGNFNGKLLDLPMAPDRPYTAQYNCQFFASLARVPIYDIINVNPWQKAQVKQFCEDTSQQPPTYFLSWLCIPPNWEQEQKWAEEDCNVKTGGHVHELSKDAANKTDYCEDVASMYGITVDRLIQAHATFKGGEYLAMVQKWCSVKKSGGVKPNYFLPIKNRWVCRPKFLAIGNITNEAATMQVLCNAKQIRTRYTSGTAGDHTYFGWRLMPIAEVCARKMAERKATGVRFYSHQQFEQPGDFDYRVFEYADTAGGITPAEDVVKAWMDIPFNKTLTMFNPMANGGIQAKEVIYNDKFPLLGVARVKTADGNAYWCAYFDQYFSQYVDRYAPPNGWSTSSCDAFLRIPVA